MNARLSRRPMCPLTAATVAVTCMGNPLREWSQAGTKWPEPAEANRIAYEAYISSRLRAPAALARERTPKLSFRSENGVFRDPLPTAWSSAYARRDGAAGSIRS
jgi:hypothetical protein